MLQFEPEVKTTVAVAERRLMLFSTRTCPNCKIAMSLFEKAGISVEKLIVDENLEIAKAYDLKMAPTLIVTDGESYEKYAGVQEIKGFINSQK